MKIIKIAIVRKSSIGDVVLATVCLDYLLKIEQQSNYKFEIVWFGNPVTLELIQSFYPSVKTYPYSSLATVFSGFDIFVDLQGNLRTKLTQLRLLFSSQTKAVGMRKNQFKRTKLIMRGYIFGRFYPQKINLPELFQWRLMVSALKKSLQGFIPSSILNSVDARPYLTSAAKINAISVAPGAQHANKSMPEDLFIKALESYLEKNDDVKIFFLGDASDFALCERIKNHFSVRVSCENLAGSTSLTETCNVLAQCILTLSNDSSVAHLSEASGTPVLSYFGPTIETFGFSPWMEGSAALSSKLGCRPCSKHGKINCRYGDHLCFRLIKTEISAELKSF